VRATLVGLCDDEVWIVKDAAIKALAKHVDDSEVRQKLIKAVREDDGHGRYAAIRALKGRANDAEMREALLVAAKDERPYVRVAAIAALARVPQTPK
jgi:HEAT repeat protein